MFNPQSFISFIDYTTFFLPLCLPIPVQQSLINDLQNSLTLKVMLQHVRKVRNRFLITYSRLESSLDFLEAPIFRYWFPCLSELLLKKIMKFFLFHWLRLKILFRVRQVHFWYRVHLKEYALLCRQFYFFSPSQSILQEQMLDL